MNFNTPIIIQKKNHHQENLRDYNLNFKIEYEILIYIFRKTKMNEIIILEDLISYFCQKHHVTVIKEKLNRIINSGIIEEHKTKIKTVLSFNTAIYNSPEILLAILMGV